MGPAICVGKKEANSAKAAVDSKAGHVLSMLFTFHVVCVGWVFFRAETNTLVLQMLQRMFTLAPATPESFGQNLAGLPQSQNLGMLLSSINSPLIYPSIFILLPVLAAAHIFMGKLNQSDWLNRTPKLAKAAWVCAMLFLVIVFSPDRSPRFIYFQF